MACSTGEIMMSQPQSRIQAWFEEVGLPLPPTPTQQRNAYMWVNGALLGTRDGGKTSDQRLEELRALMSHVGSTVQISCGEDLPPRTSSKVVGVTYCNRQHQPAVVLGSGHGSRRVIVASRIVG